MALFPPTDVARARQSPNSRPHGRTVGVGAAARRHWLLVALPTVVLAALAVLAAYARTPAYTAEARLAVGRVDPSVSGGLVGFTQATQALAERYSRSVRGDEVVAMVARARGLSAEAVRAHVSGASIPQTPVFRIIGTGDTPEGAVAIANTSAASMVEHAERESTATPLSAELLRSFRRASEFMAERRAIVAAKRQRDEAMETRSTRRDLAAARAELAAIELRVREVRGAYERSRRTAGSVALVEVLERATGAASDRFKVLQLLLFVGVVAGGSLGLALAVLRANRELRRAGA